LQRKYERRKCPDCPGSFELVLPADTLYSVPRDKPTTDDYKKLPYECDVEKHRIDVYWEKPEGDLFGLTKSNSS
jgi:hypothetical protein